MATTVDTLLVRIEADMSDLRKDLSRVTKQTEQQTTRMADGFRKVRNAVAAIGGTALFGQFLKSTINVGAQIEGLEVQLNALLGSAEEGGRAFEKMRQFASKVPFSLQQIQQGSGSLAAAAGDADELNELLQVTGNIAAQFNIPFEEASANVQRALSAGAGAADQFRDRGVLAFAGFEAGVSYSAQETARILQDTFGTGGTADGAMDEFAKTTSGALSMFGDAVFNFQASIAGSGLNDAFIGLTNQLTEIINGARSLAVVLGFLLGKALNGISIALAKVRENAETLMFAFGLFAAANVAMTFATLAVKIASVAKATTALVVAKRALNFITRKNIIALALTGAVLAFADDRLDDFLGHVSTLSEQVIEALPTSVKEGLGELGDLVTQATTLSNEAIEAANSTPETITLGGAGVDTKSLIELKKIIDSNTVSTTKLDEQVSLLEAHLESAGKNAVPFAADALANLKHQILMLDPVVASFNRGIMKMADDLSDALADALADGEFNLQSLENAFNQTLRQMLADAIRFQIIRPLISGMFGTIGGAVGGPVGDFITAIGTTPKATGGPVGRGSPYLVGERGPELFVPQGSGSVVNAATTRGLGGGGTVINQNFNVSTGVQQTVRNEIRQLMPQIADNTRAAVADAKRRGGSYGKAFA